MKSISSWIGGLLAVLLAAGGWFLLFHSDQLSRGASEEEEGGEASPAEVSVKVAPIQRATLHAYADAFGTIIPELATAEKPGAAARVASVVAGLVSKVRGAEGMPIKAGEVLLELDDRLVRIEVLKAEKALATAQASLARLKATVNPEQLAGADAQAEKAAQAEALAQTEFDRQKALLPVGTVSEKQVRESEYALRAAHLDRISTEKQRDLLRITPSPEEKAEAAAKIAEAEADLKRAQAEAELRSVRAPLDATVVKFRLNPGEAIEANAPLADLIDLSRLNIEVSIPAREVADLKIGQPAQVILKTEEPDSDEDGAESKSAEPKESDAKSPGPPTFSERVLYVGSVAEDGTDTVRVRISVTPGQGLRPGQAVRVKIVLQEHKDCLAIPEAGLVRNPEGQSQIVLVAAGKAALKPVHRGLMEGGLAEVLEPSLQAGQTVVTEGAYGLADGTQLRIEEK